jgi:hypothetical protein
MICLESTISFYRYRNFKNVIFINLNLVYLLSLIYQYKEAKYLYTMGPVGFERFYTVGPVILI